MGTKTTKLRKPLSYVDNLIERKLNDCDGWKLACYMLDGGFMRVFLHGAEHIDYHVETGEIFYQDSYHFQGDNKIIASVDLLQKLYEKIIKPKIKVGEFDDVRLGNIKRITEKDKVIINAYRENMKNKDFNVLPDAST